MNILIWLTLLWQGIKFLAPWLFGFIVAALILPLSGLTLEGSGWVLLVVSLCIGLWLRNEGFPTLFGK